MRILFLQSDPHCSCTRKISYEISAELTRKGYISKVESVFSLNENEVNNFDVFVFQRIGANSGIITSPLYTKLEKFIKLCNSQRKPVFYHIDDLVIARQNYMPTKFMKLVDAIIVPNDRLKEVVSRYTSFVEICRTHIKLPDIPVNSIKINKSIAVASTGGLGALFLKNLIPRLINRDPQITFKLIGSFRNITSHSNVSYYPIISEERLVSIFSETDLILNLTSIPETLNALKFSQDNLTSEDFLNCKCEIKYLMAGIARTPILTVPTAPYAHAIKDGENGFLLKEDVNNWENKIIDILNSDTSSVIEKAYKNVTEEYSLSKRTEEYLSVFKKYTGKPIEKPIEELQTFPSIITPPTELTPFVLYRASARQKIHVNSKLNAISLLVGTYDRINNCDIVLKVLNPNLSELRRATYNLSRLHKDTWIKFCFNTLDITGYLWIDINLERADSKNHVALFSSKKPGMSFRKNKIDIPGTILFRPHFEEEKNINVLGEIINQRITQEIVSARNGLKGFSLKTGTYRRVNNYFLNFKIKENGKVIREFISSTSKFKDNDFYMFTFTPISDSKNKFYDLEIAPVNGKRGNAVTFYYEEKGTLLVNEKELEGSLIHKLHY